MKRIVIVLGIVVLAAAAWWGYSSFLAQPGGADGSAAAQGPTTPAAQADNLIWASGKLMPVQWAGLSPAAAGTVRALHVKEGDKVQAGTLLVELQNDVLQSQVDAANAALAEAQAAEDKLLAGSTASALAAGRAQVAAADASLAQARAALQQAQDGVAAAQAQVSIAQAQYNELAARPSAAERVEAQKAVDLAAAAVGQAQAAYNRVRGNPNVGALPESLNLQQATASYEAAKASYDVVLQGATPQQRAVAQAQINAARVQVQVAQSQIPAAEAAVQSAAAGVAGSQAHLDALTEGATAADKAMAAARVASARAALATAQAQLQQTQIVAPFEGQVGALAVRLGELAPAGQPLLTLGDTRAMRVETTDLRETDVRHVQVSMPVEVTFDALAGQTFQGTVTYIAPMNSEEKGSTNYTVYVDIPQLDPNLRWGMTAFVNIQPR